MDNLKNNILDFIQSNSYKVLFAFAILTLAVCFTPLFFEDPGDASLDPKKEAYEVQQRINEKFVEAVQFVSFVIKADALFINLLFSSNILFNSFISSGITSLLKSIPV